MRDKKLSKILVLIPTYNEFDNIGVLIGEIERLKIPNLDILVVDDGSSDGTDRLVIKLSKKYRNIFLLERGKKMGIGSAHIDGINWAYRKGYERLISMDADLTHSPKYFKDLIIASYKYDVVIASRHLVRNSMIGWSFKRKILTFLNHNLVKYILGLNYDTSNSFRIYRLDKIPRKIFNLISSSGYSFFFESLKILKLNCFTIGEVPVVMRERQKGVSKLSFRDFFLHFWFMMRLIFMILFRRSCLLANQ